jgi:hypothetical protein
MKSSTFSRILGACLLLGLAAACGSDDDEGTGASGATFSCTTQTGTGTGCQEYVGTGEPVASMQQACTDGGGTVGKSCSTSGVSGVCTIASNGGASIRMFYYGFDADAVESAKGVCTQTGGTWSNS